MKWKINKSYYAKTEVKGISVDWQCNVNDKISEGTIVIPESEFNINLSDAEIIDLCCKHGLNKEFIEKSILEKIKKEYEQAQKEGRITQY